MNKKIIAIMYDFDKTLCDRDMQEYSFIPMVKQTADEFWENTSKIAGEQNMDKILSYMYHMMKSARKNGFQITKKLLNGLGKDIILYDGVVEFFDRMNKYASNLGFKIEHYIISSGLKEIIEGTKIAKEFTEIYACDFHYDQDGFADFPSNVINYTTKTQFLFRISKGVLDKTDDVALNAFTAEVDRRIPYSQMIYVGDGITDVPCMRLLKKSGGRSIAVYAQGKINRVKSLLLDQRCDFISLADYKENSELDNIIKMIITQIYVQNNMMEKIANQVDSFKKIGS